MYTYSPSAVPNGSRMPHVRTISSDCDLGKLRGAVVWAQSGALCVQVWNTWARLDEPRCKFHGRPFELGAVKKPIIASCLSSFIPRLPSYPFHIVIHCRILISVHPFVKGVPLVLLYSYPQTWLRESLSRCGKPINRDNNDYHGFCAFKWYLANFQRIS